MPFSPMGSSLFQSPQLIFKALKHPYNGKSSSAHTFCFLLLSQRQLLFDSYWRKKVNWPLRLPQFFYIVCFNCFHFHNFGHYVLLILCFARLTFLNPWSLPCIWYDFTAWVRSRGNQIEVSSWVFSWWSHTRYAQFFSERIVTTYEKHSQRGKLFRDSVCKAFIGGWSRRHSLLSASQNPRLPEGKQVYHKPHVCTKTV